MAARFCKPLCYVNAVPFRPYSRRLPPPDFCCQSGCSGMHASGSGTSCRVWNLSRSLLNSESRDLRTTFMSRAFCITFIYTPARGFRVQICIIINYVVRSMIPYPSCTFHQVADSSMDQTDVAAAKNWSSSASVIMQAKSSIVWHSSQLAARISPVYSAGPPGLGIPKFPSIWQIP